MRIVSLVPTTPPSVNCWVARVQLASSNSVPSGGGAAVHPPVSLSKSVVSVTASSSVTLRSSTHVPRPSVPQSVTLVMNSSTCLPANGVRSTVQSVQPDELPVNAFHAPLPVSALSIFTFS